MLFNKSDVFEMCEKIAPKYKFEPSLIKALCQQECEHRVVGKDGKLHFNPDIFRADKVRLEQNYYDKYVERQNEFASTTEGLFALSWGIMQIMGLSLKELKFFEWFFDQQSEATKIFLGNPYSELTVPKALNWLVVNLDAMVEWGCKWLDRKRTLAKGDINKMLDFWNGCSDGSYHKEVLEKQKNLM